MQPSLLASCWSCAVVPRGLIEMLLLLLLLQSHPYSTESFGMPPASIQQPTESLPTATQHSC